MVKTELLAKVKELITAPSCNSDLKAAAENYLDLQDKANADKLIKALNENVNSIDETLGFVESEMGAKVFGKEQADNMSKSFRKAKEGGEKFCLCPACQAGAAIYANKESL